MTQLLVLREHIQKFYQKYALVLNPLFRFIIGFITFSSINRIIGYNPALNQIYIELLLALISVLMPGGVLLFFGAVFASVHIFYVSKMLALVVAAIFAVLYFAYIKFVPKHAYAIVAIPITFPLNLVYGVPILLGLFMTPIAVVPIICGVGIYYLMQSVIFVVSTSTDTSINLYHAMLQQFFNCKEMYAMIVVFSAVSVLVYILRNREWNFSFEIAIVAGIVTNAILLLIIKYILDINMNIAAFFIGSIFSGILVWIIQFMHLALNYAGVENLQFEDEEYYYYVRAVPKMNVAAPSKRVKRINARHFSEHMSGIRHEKDKEE